MRIILWIVIVLLSFAAGYIFSQENTETAGPLPETEDALLVSNQAEEDAKPTSNPQEEAFPLGLTEQEKHNIRLFEQAAPSVCYITTTQQRRSYYSRNIQEIPAGSGSGFIWDRQGHIVTNYHVIQNSSRALVTLSDGNSYEATLVGVAPEKDLAVLKIEVSASELRPIPVGSSSDLRVGQSVYAIGNPFGLDQTLTTGVISALGREIKSVAGIPIRDVIQSDAAINPGNSGGPLLNSSGQLIGVNTAIYSPSGASAGIGFSIPVDVVRWVVPDLIQYGEVNRPLIGVELTRPISGIEGAIVLNIVKNSPADRAGIRPITVDRYGNMKLGDIIVAINGEPIKQNSDLFLVLEKYKAGDEVLVTVQRGEDLVDLPVRLTSSKD
ncbi:MAG: PDZ domain-containing protein [Bacteroidetes bacterium]|nr:MAG: PDZ domain-containing protein [Bacteroidota bacterium]